MKQRTESELMHLAAAYCSVSERCLSEVRKKLVAAGASPEVIQRIITRLVKEKFVDEKRYSRSFVNDKFRFNGWGRMRIRYELLQKGIPPDVVSDALDTIGEETYSMFLADLLWEKKGITKGTTEREIFLKLYRFASSRGFEGPLILSCLRALFRENYDVDDM
jgi:regulatory protein